MLRAWLAGLMSKVDLSRYAEPGVDGLVFPAPESGFLRLENFRRRAWTPATIAAGVAPLRLHDLRHTCASLSTSFAAGADAKVLPRMLGHASAALTLDRYGHLMPGQGRCLTRPFVVVETGVDPVTSRFSGARSAN